MSPASDIKINGICYGEYDHEIVAPEQAPLLQCLGPDFLHYAGINALRDSISEMKTSSRENWVGCPKNHFHASLLQLGGCVLLLRAHLPHTR